MSIRIPRVAAAAAALLMVAAPARTAQAVAPGPVVTAEDYARAEKFLGGNVASLVLKASVRPNWMAGDRFWYRNRLARGAEFILVDPARGFRGPAVDQAGVAAALSAAEGKTFDPAELPFTEFEYTAEGKGMTFLVGGRRYSCDLSGRGLKIEKAAPGEAAPRRSSEPEAVSPDGRLVVFIRAGNLWLRERTTGVESQLTFDGVKDYGYATDNAGWTKSDRPVVSWSPDGKKIATFQQDQRGVGEMYLVDTRVGHPVLQAWKYPLPGDEMVTMIERVVIHLDGPRVVRLKMPPDEHRASVADDIKADDGSMEDVVWSPDSLRLAFVSTSRDHKTAWLREADPETGDVRTIFRETAPTYFESGADGPCWRYLPDSGEFIWFSEREDMGRLYLHDLRTGRLKNAVTSGPGRVAGVVRVDEKKRRLVFVGLAMEPGRDPYFRHLYSGRVLPARRPPDDGSPVRRRPPGPDP
jgi:dipeptidyl-peptidase-4